MGLGGEVGPPFWFSPYTPSPSHNTSTGPMSFLKGTPVTGPRSPPGGIPVTGPRSLLVLGVIPVPGGGSQTGGTPILV